MYWFLQVIKEETTQSGFAVHGNVTSPKSISHKNSGSQTDDCCSYYLYLTHTRAPELCNSPQDYKRAVCNICHTANHNISSTSLDARWSLGFTLLRKICFPPGLVNVYMNKSVHRYIHSSAALDNNSLSVFSSPRSADDAGMLPTVC